MNQNHVTSFPIKPAGPDCTMVCVESTLPAGSRTDDHGCSKNGIHAMLIVCKKMFWLLLLLNGSAPAQMSDNELFGLVNQDYAGLETVKTALAAGDTSLATRELLRYYQYRTAVNYFPLSSGGSVSEAEENRNHTFTVVSIKKYAGAADGSIDWSTKDAQDAEWHYQFHRMYWLENYGKVYASTRNEIYATACVADMLDWIKDNPAGYPRTLDTGVRLKSWTDAYQYFVTKYRSPSVTPEAHLTMLKSLILQCRFLRDNWRSEGNWGASETQGLGYVVTMFPEMTFSKATSWGWWKDLVVSRFEHHLSGDFYPDGVQFETSPSYGCLEYRNLFLTYKLMSMNALPMSEEVTNLFIRPLEYMMHIHRPDGNLAQFSDTDRGGYLSYLKEGAELFQRQDMLFAATKGAQGTPPPKTFAAFPDGGVFVMRSDWGANQAGYANTKYLAFDMSSNEPWHAHSDILTFEAYANGSLLIRDPGRYTYVAGTWRDYFRGTAAHNTVVVDNRDQALNMAGHPDSWSSLPGYDYVSGSHQSYSGLDVQRSVMFVKPEYWIITDVVTGSGTHTYDLYFHLSAAFKNTTTLDAATHAVATPQFGIFPSDSSAQSEILSGWVSDSYSQKSEAPVVRRRKTGSPPVTFESVVVPFVGVAPRFQVDRQTVFNGATILAGAQATSVRILKENTVDWFFRARNGGTSLAFGPFRSDAAMAFIRQRGESDIAGIQIANGSLLSYGDTLLYDTNGMPASVSYSQNTIFVEAVALQYLRIWAPATHTVVVNGAAVAATREGMYLVYGSATGVRELMQADQAHHGTQLEQNYPNPFNPATVITYRLEVEGRVSVKVFDVLGREVATLVDAVQPGGTYQVTFNAGGLAGGFYICRLMTGTSVNTKTMILLP